MDWAWIYYCSTVLLRMTEEQFWASTPRKIALLIDQYLHHQAMIHGVETSNEKHDDEAFNALVNL